MSEEDFLTWHRAGVRYLESTMDDFLAVGEDDEERMKFAIEEMRDELDRQRRNLERAEGKEKRRGKR